MTWLKYALEFLKSAYGAFGVKHPYLSIAAMGLLGAIVFMSAWWGIGELYEADLRRSVALPFQVTTLPSEIAFKLGENGIEFRQTIEALRRGPSTAVRLGKNSSIKMYVEGNTLYLDADLYAGKSTIQIRRNEVNIKSRNDLDTNRSDSAVEIVDDKQRPIFQMIRKNPSLILINGIFRTGSGYMIADDSSVRTFSLSHDPGKLSVNRIFRYPAWKYPGQYGE